MPLDPTLVRGLTPIAMPERDPNAAVNQLGMMMKMQELQSGIQSNQLNAQKYQQDIATSQATERKTRLEAKVNAFRNGAAMAGEDPKTLMGLLTTAAQDPELSEALGLGPQHVQFIGSQLNDPAKVTMLARRMRGMTPKEEADLNKPSDYAQTLVNAGYAPGSPEFMAAMRDKARKDVYIPPTEAGRPPASVQEAMWLATATPEQRQAFLDAKSGGGMNEYQRANLEIEQAKNKREEDKAVAEQEAVARARQSAMSGAEESYRLVSDAIGRARGLTSATSTGVGSLIDKLPLTDARALANEVNTIKANLGFDRLRQMREESKTGGALGQVAVKELERLESAVAGLDTGLSAPKVREQLDRVQRHYDKWLLARRQAAESENAPGAAPVGGAAASTSVPAVGAVENGYQFKGGDPSNPESWEKL